MNLNTTKNTFSKILLSLLIIVGMAFFVAPVQNIDAQSGRGTPFCFNSSTGDVKTPSSTGNPCPTGSVVQTINPAPTTAVCVLKNSATQYTLINGVGVTTNGECANSAGVVIPNSLYKLLKNIPAHSNSTTNTNGNGNGNSNGNSNGNGNSGGGNTNNTTPPQVQGGCEDGFHEVGPLCVPNSGFKDTSLVGTATAPGLAVKIIRIMLYFAGIVAIVMIIVGGYQVMTAGGNPAQAVNGRKTLTNAIIGLIIVILAYVIVYAVINFVTT